MNGIHYQGALHGNEAAQARIATLKFLHHQAVGDVGHFRTAVTFQVRTEKSQLAQLRHQFHRESGFAIVLRDDWNHSFLDELPREPNLPAAVPAPPIATRSIYLDGAWLPAPAYDFAALPPGQEIAGPAIVESTMTTVLLRPGDRAISTAQSWLNIDIE